MSKKYTAFIALRGGSKSIPGKNIRLLAGKPLALWAIEVSSTCPLIEMTYVSTDDEQIRTVIEAAQLPRVEVINRSSATASETASTESALIEFAINRKIEYLVLLQATSPLITVEDLVGGIQCFETSGADSLLSVVEQKRFIWAKKDQYAVPTNYDPFNRIRRQDFDPYFVENGAFYIFRCEDLLRTASRLSGRISIYVMPEETYYEIDELSDWIIIESIIQSRYRETASTFLKP